MKKTKAKKFNNNGITLIALVITIIILLILAGISILALTENGLFVKAKEAREETETIQIQEEIQLAIMEIQMEEVSKGKDEILEILANGKLEEKLEGITAQLSNEITGEYKGYNYTIDDKLNVTIGSKILGISFKYTLSHQGYTNQDIILTISATSTNGDVIIEGPSTLTKNSDGNYVITKNGSYEFSAQDSSGERKSKTIKIDKIDKLKPENFLPVIEEVKAKNFKIIANVEDVEDASGENAKSGIDYYEYYVNDVKYTSKESNFVTEVQPNTKYTVYVIAYDVAGNSITTQKISCTTTDVIPILTSKGVEGFSTTDNYYVKEYMCNRNFLDRSDDLQQFV